MSVTDQPPEIPLAVDIHPGVLGDVAPPNVSGRGHLFKVCAACKCALPRSAFFARNSRRNGLAPKCKACEVADRRGTSKANKQKLVEVWGGKCTACGYSKSMAALQFHHTGHKEESISRLLRSSFQKALAEAVKCTLLCANCHAELHEREETQGKARGRRVTKANQMKQ